MTEKKSTLIGRILMLGIIALSPWLGLIECLIAATLVGGIFTWIIPSYLVHTCKHEWTHVGFGGVDCNLLAAHKFQCLKCGETCNIVRGRMTKVGDRVTAIRNAEKGIVYSFGDGIYAGDFIPPDDIGFGIPNPRIDLDSGGSVWGCECWWGSESGAHERFSKGWEWQIVQPNRTPAKE